MANWAHMGLVERDTLIGRTIGYQSPVHTLAGDWHPTRDIADAWDVVKAMHADGLFVTVDTGPDGFTSALIYRVNPKLAEGGHVPLRDYHVRVAEAHDVSAPEAICLAALRAKGVTV